MILQVELEKSIADEIKTFSDYTMSAYVTPHQTQQEITLPKIVIRADQAEQSPLWLAGVYQFNVSATVTVDAEDVDGRNTLHFLCAAVDEAFQSPLASNNFSNGIVRVFGVVPGAAAEENSDNRLERTREAIVYAGLLI